jgi:hypothetical protein
MPLRDQPYLPLYVQDFLTDEKLMECSASATGIYIRLMCIMHKSDEYGVILLKQKDKQTSSSIKNFALKLARFMPYQIEEITEGLAELLEAGVIQNGGDKLTQKRMVRDNKISEVRSKAGKKGGLKTQKFAKAKIEANTEYENEYKNDIDFDIEKGSLREKELKSQFEIFRQSYPGTKRGIDAEFENLKKKHKNWREVVPVLSDSLSYQMSAREMKRQKGGFVPEWKNLQTWINQKCWEEEIETNNISNEVNSRNNKQGASYEQLASLADRKGLTPYTGE